MSDQTKLSCNLVRDILPLYKEELLSEESKIEIDEHLKECVKCEELFCKMDEPLIESKIDSNKNDIDVLKKYNKLHKVKTIFVVVTTIIIITALLCGLQYLIHYYNNPYTIDKSNKTTGYILHNSDSITSESVKVDLNIQKMHYFFKNEFDYVQGNIMIDNYALCGDYIYDGFITMFTDEQKYHSSNYTLSNGSNNLIEMITVSDDAETIIGVVNTYTIPSVQGDLAALLVAPANSEEEALEILKEAQNNSDDFALWLEENGWNLN